jgi:LVIVD repeat
MTIVVVAASTNSPDFAVIDFTSATPTSVMVGASAGGNVVDCYGTLAAVGDCTSGKVTIFDISHPASPTLRSSVNTGLSGIGAISMDDKNILVGQNNGSQVALVNISNSNSPTLTTVYSDNPWLGAISTLAMRGTSAVVGGTDGFGVLDFSGHSTPAWIAYPPSLGNLNLSGQNLVDFDGTNAAVTTPAPPPGSFQVPNAYVYGISGNIASGPTTVANSNLATSIAIAEIPDGSGYLLAEGGEQAFWVSCFPSRPPSKPVGKTSLAPNTGDTAVAVKFLNNPAVAPLLAVANVTNEGFFVTEYFIQVEQIPANDGGLTNSLSLATPNPVAKVALNPTLSPTLGITGFTIKLIIPPPHWWPLPGWLWKLVQRIFG